MAAAAAVAGGPSGRSIGGDFAKFSSEFPLHKALQPRTELEWAYYQAGSSSGSAEPIIFCHGTSGTAAAFFYQVEALARKGYRVLSAQYPAYDTPEDWCKGFDHFLDAMKCRSAHLFGAGLGGFLVQHFAVRYPHRVRSLLLCNAYATTNPFAEKAGSLASMVHITPTALLRKVILDSFPQGGMELLAKQAIDFVASQVGDLSGNDLASRLSLNSTASSVGAMSLDQARITLMESDGETMVPEGLRRQLRQLYPGARVAQLKASGDFPYLSRPDEATLFVEVHMRAAGVFPDGAVPAGWLAGREAAAAAPPSAAAAAAAAPQPPQPAAAAVWRDEPQAGAERAVQKRPQWVNPFEDDLPSV